MVSNLALSLLLMIAGAAATVEQVEYLDAQQSSPADHRLSKRMDLEVCIGHFDVHKNTIIRTGESQAIGGKYLQGLELDTIEECERLCCETDACDVYIFERKAGGYCYLFECGPPEDFRCKFTRHANYTSAVLNPQPRQANEMVSTPRPQLPHIPSNNVSQQEWELSNLKLKPEARDKPTLSTAAVVVPTSGTGAGSGVGVGLGQSAVYQAQSAPAAHCGRFQFTCHSGECIAVYNACDGIPQCEDGSDEGPELCVNCETHSTRLLPCDAYNLPRFHSLADEQSHIFSHKGGLQLQQPSNGQGQIQQGPASAVQVQGQSAPLQLPGYDGNQAVYGMSLPRSGIYLSQQQLPASAGQQQQQQVPSNAVWPPQTPLAPQQQSPVQQQQQPSLAPQQPGHVYAPASAIQSPPAQQQSMLPVLNAAPAMGKNQGPSVDGDYEDYDEETYTEAPKKKQHKHKKVKAKTAKDPIELALEQNKQQQDATRPVLPVPVSPVHEQYKMIHENLAMEFRDHDGHSERPGGAVLSLTLGLLVTAALAILIGCRMRTVSRRARRLGGKTPYSQEADFLVNGMYL
ncbi:hypothetical protein M5D96_005178 [Drosophila gunungcola]|uniref:MANSC domain-containing protein n=1 Tax=Drosophila gunungcola TaxID=103775 RepID=A0A9P9YVC1_9MUSC|nr:hypothetical protein M5D96_005178 [Drosophila gunungcola]